MTPQSFPRARSIACRCGVVLAVLCLASAALRGAEGAAARVLLLPAGARASIVVELDDETPDATAIEATDNQSFAVEIGPVHGKVVNQLLEAAQESPLVRQVRVRGVTQGDEGTVITLQIVAKTPVSGSVRRAQRRIYIDLEPRDLRSVGPQTPDRLATAETPKPTQTSGSDVAARVKPAPAKAAPVAAPPPARVGAAPAQARPTNSPAAAPRAAAQPPPPATPMTTRIPAPTAAPPPANAPAATEVVMPRPATAGGTYTGGPVPMTSTPSTPAAGTNAAAAADTNPAPPGGAMPTPARFRTPELGSGVPSGAPTVAPAAPAAAPAGPAAPGATGVASANSNVPAVGSGVLAPGGPGVPAAGLDEIQRKAEALVKTPDVKGIEQLKSEVVARKSAASAAGVPTGNLDAVIAKLDQFVVEAQRNQLAADATLFRSGASGAASASAADFQQAIRPLQPDIESVSGALRGWSGGALPPANLQGTVASLLPRLRGLKPPTAIASAHSGMCDALDALALMWAKAAVGPLPEGTESAVIDRARQAVDDFLRMQKNLGGSPSAGR